MNEKQDIRDAWRAVRASGVTASGPYREAGDALCDAYEALVKDRDELQRTTDEWKKTAEMYCDDARRNGEAIEEIRKLLGTTVRASKVPELVRQLESDFQATAKDRDEWAAAIRTVAPGYISSAHAAKHAIADLKAKWDAAKKQVENLEVQKVELTCARANRDALYRLAAFCNVQRTIEREPFASPGKIAEWCEQSITSTLKKFQEFRSAVAYELGAERNPDLALDSLKARLEELKELKASRPQRAVETELVQAAFDLRQRLGIFPDNISTARFDAAARALMLRKPQLYECEACSSKPGSPTLCADCLRARAKAGKAWIGGGRPEPAGATKQKIRPFGVAEPFEHPTWRMFAEALAEYKAWSTPPQGSTERALMDDFRAELCKALREVAIGHGGYPRFAKLADKLEGK
jgi:hypothetical protein